MIKMQVSIFEAIHIYIMDEYDVILNAYTITYAIMEQKIMQNYIPI